MKTLKTMRESVKLTEASSTFRTYVDLMRFLNAGKFRLIFDGYGGKDVYTNGTKKVSVSEDNGKFTVKDTK